MQVTEWRRVIGDMVREHMRSPELEHYFSVPMNKPRAQLMITQLGLYIRHRRDCWALVSANCPVMGVKQAILQHEYGEVIKDQFSDYGHLHLIIRQAEKLGMTPQEVIDTKPITTTTATLYAWAWLTHDRRTVGSDRYRVDQRRPLVERHRWWPFDAHGQALDG
jgi:pyrroloquinoline quinone (PQQ) biosynthesis protein C